MGNLHIIQGDAAGGGLSGTYPNPTVLPAPTSDVTGTAQAMVAGTKYYANNPAARITFTLPPTASVGSQFLLRGKAAGGWKVAQNASQTIHGSSDTTTGTGGSLMSQARYDCVTLECVAANTDFIIINQRGTLTIV